MTEQQAGPTLEELHALVLELEQKDDLVDRIAKLSDPRPARWYDRPILLGFLGTLFAAVIPSATAINGCIQKSTELQLAKQRLDHEITSAYISSYALKDALVQALNPSLSAAHRIRALRFLEIAVQDSGVRKWAQAEMMIAKEYEESQTDGLLVAPKEEAQMCPDEIARKSEDRAEPKRARSQIRRELKEVERNPILGADEKWRQIHCLQNRINFLNAVTGNLVGGGEWYRLPRGLVRRVESVNPSRD